MTFPNSSQFSLIINKDDIDSLEDFALKKVHGKYGGDATFDFSNDIIVDKSKLKNGIDPIDKEIDKLLSQGITKFVHK